MCASGGATGFRSLVGLLVYKIYSLSGVCVTAEVTWESRSQQPRRSTERLNAAVARDIVQAGLIKGVSEATVVLAGGWDRVAPGLMPGVVGECFQISAERERTDTPCCLNGLCWILVSLGRLARRGRAH